MIIRFILGACIAAIACGPALADRSRGDPDRPVITGPLPNAKDVQVKRRATRIDVDRLKKLKLRPTSKCARIEYVHQCLSSQNMTLVRARCRAGQTTASCCQGARNHVTSNICGPIWDRYKQAGKAYNPGIWLCKCIELGQSRREFRRQPRRPGAARPGDRHPPDPYEKELPPDPIEPPDEEPGGNG
ncbi:MAG: hypothetical protein ACOC91_02925 [bacterium]